MMAWDTTWALNVYIKDLESNYFILAFHNRLDGDLDNIMDLNDYITNFISRNIWATMTSLVSRMI